MTTAEQLASDYNICGRRFDIIYEIARRGGSIVNGTFGHRYIFADGSTIESDWTNPNAGIEVHNP